MTKEDKNIEIRNNLIFVGYYVFNFTSSELSITFGISRQMVEKIVKKILEKK